MGNVKRNTTAPLNGIIDSMVVGHRREVTVDMFGSSSYATGGDTLSVKEVSGGNILEADFVDVSPLTNDGAYRLSVLYSGTGKSRSVKIVAEVFTTDAEVANAVDWSTKKFKVRIRGV